MYFDINLCVQDIFFKKKEVRVVVKEKGLKIKEGQYWRNKKGDVLLVGKQVEDGDWEVKIYSNITWTILFHICY